jgi:DNA polymerase-3 subunit alpha
MPDVPEYPRRELLNMERATTGLYLSGHPMQEMHPLSRRCGATDIIAINLANAPDNEEVNTELCDGCFVTVSGIISSLKTKYTKSGKQMAMGAVEDETGSIELLAFETALQTGGKDCRAGNKYGSCKAICFRCADSGADPSDSRKTVRIRQCPWFVPGL